MPTYLACRFVLLRDFLGQFSVHDSWTSFLRVRAGTFLKAKNDSLGYAWNGLIVHVLN